MDPINRTIRTVRSFYKLDDATSLNYISCGIFALSMLYIFYHSKISTISLAIGVALILYAITGGNLAASLIGGALAGLMTLHYSRHIEKFANEDDEDADDKEEEFEDVPKKKKKTKRAPPPDNGDRAEMLELGKKYKMPSEDDDKDFHLDAGTTYMNAYKSLKPDQIAAMTKDTQDLMTTQKQLMSTLQTLKPLIKDGQEMMDVFQGYFGAGGSPTAN